MSRENRTHHERMWMTRNDGHSSDLSQAVQCAMWRCSDRQRTMHSSVRVDELCVEVSHGGHVVIGIGRVIEQRHHADIPNYWILTFVLLLQLCTCSQTVCRDRQFFPVVKQSVTLFWSRLKACGKCMQCISVQDDQPTQRLLLKANSCNVHCATCWWLKTGQRNKTTKWSQHCSKKSLRLRNYTNSRVVKEKQKNNRSHIQKKR